MGLNMSVLCAEGEDEARMLAAAVGWEPTGHRVPADLESAVLEAGPAVGATGGWTLLFDPGVGLALDPVSAGLATRGGRGIAAAWQSSTDTYVFDVYEDGLRTRGQVRTIGRLIVDDGEPLSEEAGLVWDADPEEAMAGLVARVTGLCLLSRQLAEVPVRPLRRRPTLR